MELSGTRVRSGNEIKGFTLIELMVTISVLGVLLALAVPSFSNATLGGKLGATANDLVASAHLARSEAIKRNGAVRLCIAPNNGTACASGSWHQGWIVIAADGTLIFRHSAAPTGFLITESSSTTSVEFLPSGGVSTPASLKVCRSSPLGSQERVVRINAAGRAKVRKETTGSCS
ncbi:MAG: GspH/FimT family pseudopilin [Azoarcus sp.]|nr:GspH/FimT family pseudopilin [Azoarcus sp.]